MYKEPVAWKRRAVEFLAAVGEAGLGKQLLVDFDDHLDVFPGPGANGDAGDVSIAGGADHEQAIAKCLDGGSRTVLVESNVFFLVVVRAGFQQVGWGDVDLFAGAIDDEVDVIIPAVGLIDAPAKRLGEAFADKGIHLFQRIALNRELA